MKSYDFDREVRFEIVEHIAVLASHSTGWRKELNLVRWNGGPPKYDIRDWSPNHEHMSRGTTLHEKEMRHICEALRLRRGKLREKQEEEMKETMNMSFDIAVADETVDVIMSEALSGIARWCDEAEVVGEYLGTHAHEQVSRGGQLKMHEIEEDDTHILTREKFFKGLRLYVEEGCCREDILEFVGGGLRIDAMMVDAAVADAIVQYALFGEVVYG